MLTSVDAVSERFRGLFSQPFGGVVGAVDELLAICREHEVDLHAQADRCRWFLPDGEERQLTEVPWPRVSVFRALLARIIAVGNAHSAEPISPYGGVVRWVDPADGTTVWTATVQNTTSEQDLHLTSSIRMPRSTIGSSLRIETNEVSEISSREMFE